MNKEKNFINTSTNEKEKINSKLSNDSNQNFFLAKRDSVRLDTPIRDRFNVLLRRIGRSQNWLAGEVGISNGTMSKIANGEWFPTSQVMSRIAEILEVDSVVIFGDSIYWKNWHDKIIYEGGK